MNSIPGRTGLASQVYDCSKVMLTTSEYIVSRDKNAARQFDIDVRGITMPQIYDNTVDYSQHMTLPHDASSDPP
jgi:hypothetical protein